MRPAVIGLAVLLSSAIAYAPAYAMCGGGGGSAAPNQSTAKNQCGGGMGGMDMGDKGPAGKGGAAGANPDPHAGMDMGKAAKPAGGCCSCCDGMGSGAEGGGKGGMCGGKQAAATPEDGSGDPLLKDPMWNKPARGGTMQSQPPTTAEPPKN